MDKKEYDKASFLEEKQAYKLAQEAIDRESVYGGLAFSSWKGASLKNPVLVRTVHSDPSYWLFPVEINGKIVGFVRVLGSGRVAHVGSFSHSPDGSNLTEITGLTEVEATMKACERIHPNEGETLSRPFFVHDGPVGREAWLVEVLKEGKPHRWIFVTGSFIYERPAEVELDNSFE